MRRVTFRADRVTAFPPVQLANESWWVDAQHWTRAEFQRRAQQEMPRMRASPSGRLLERRSSGAREPL